MILFLISIGAFAATFIGGLIALRFKDKLHLVLGFSAGAVIAVALFDLLPEAIELVGESHEVSFVTMLVAVGFVIYMILDRLVLFHSHTEEQDCHNSHHQPKSAVFSATSMSVHSFLDGIAVGLAFQVSAAVGAVVALAVLVHKFSDGMNTVGVIIRSAGSRTRALTWLSLASLAPVLGIISTLFFSVSGNSLGVILAIFCGFFLYIGASDLLPESHHGHPVFATTFMTILGIAVLYGAITIAGV